MSQNPIELAAAKLGGTDFQVSSPVDATSNWDADTPQRRRYTEGAALPRPRWRLWRTRLKRPRPIRQFAPRIDLADLGSLPEDSEPAHWGEYVLLEDIVSVLHRDGTVTTLQHTITFLHGSEQLAQWDEVVRWFDLRKERYRILTARLYLPDGSTQNARRIAMPGGAVNPNGRAIQLSFSPLRPGVVLEYEEQFDSFQLDEFGPVMCNHYFMQTASPCRRRRVTVAVANPFSMAHKVHHGDYPPTERRCRGYSVLTWDSHDVAGIEVDDWTPPVRDFVPWIDFTSVPDWSPFASKLRDELAPVSRTPSEVRKLAQELATDRRDAADKAVAAYTYTAREVRYGRPPQEVMARNSRAAAETLEDLRGDCKDKSALLVQLLREMKLSAQIAVVLTADMGRTPFLPSTRFNHAVVKLTLDGDVYWLDAANGPFAFADLPNIDQNIAALVLDDDSFAFEQIPLLGRKSYIEWRRCEGILDDNGAYTFSAEIRLTGESAARLRFYLLDRSEEHCQDTLQRFIGDDQPGAIARDIRYTAADDLTGPFPYSYRATVDRVARRVKNIVLVRIPWASRTMLTGPLAATTRTLPLALPPASRSYERHIIRLPDRVRPYAVPDPVSVHCEWGEYECSLQERDGRLLCERRFDIRGGIVPVERFVEFKDFWQQCVWSDTAEIVLRDK